jgi:hypothetical protein
MPGLVVASASAPRIALALPGAHLAGGGFGPVLHIFA